jgi:hypothetical protein
MKLFAIYIGGEFPGANIEIHDVRFVVAASIEDTHDELRRQWWGAPRSLHIDCWTEVVHADGYDISLLPEPYVGPEKLFFVNLGGYERGEFAERHRNVFVVAENEAKAKSRALKGVREWIEPHRDDLYEAEKAFCLSEPIGDLRLHVHLQRATTVSEPASTCRYVPILKGRASILS